MAQTWSYADVRPIDEWDDGLNAFRKACKDNWGYRAEAAGYKLKKGADLVETVVPLWQNSAGDYTELNTGEVLQFSLVTEKYITFMSEVTPEYYILLVLKPEGNYGRARHELSKAKHLLRDELI